VTESMNRAITETLRRRAIQEAYNKEHGITPETIRKNIRSGIEAEAAAHKQANAAVGKSDDEEVITMEYLNELEKEMLDAAEQLEFERAAVLRDRIEEMRKNLGKKVGIVNFDKITPKSRKRKRGGGG
jgi:Helicase subunit of the DNA excision repair complex